MPTNPLPNPRPIESIPDQPAKHFPFSKLKLFLLTLFLIPTPLLAVGSWYLSIFTSSSGLTFNQLTSKIQTGLSLKPPTHADRTNFLILGIDTISGQKENSLLTDTIIILSLHHPSGQLQLFSLPRDLWIDAYKTKINALYFYTVADSDPNFVSDVIEQITALPIHRTLVLDLDFLEEFIDQLGGVSLEVPETFTDTRFPRHDVDIHNVTDEEELYETVSFSQGEQTFNGQTALKYIRSRSSQDSNQGTDTARSQRQQQLFLAVMDKLKNQDTIFNPAKMGKIYRLLRSQSGLSTFSDEEALALAKSLGFKSPTIESFNLPVSDEPTSGLLYHPPVSKHDQWVYEPADPTWVEMQNYIRSTLEQGLTAR